MTPAEIMDYLVRTLAGDNAAEFSRRTGIATTTIAQIRNGRIGIRRQVDKILQAYPQVNRSFLETGVGYPGDLTAQMELERYRALVIEKEKEIQLLLKEIELQQKILEKFTTHEK